MNDLLYWFIIVFMIHEFEEIIFLPSWMRKNKNMLVGKFPAIRRVLNKIGGISASAFAFVVFEEYIVLLLITAGAMYFNFYYLWIGVFMAFFIHLMIHIAQWLLIRKYAPFIVSSIVCLPYCVYVFKILITTTDYKTIILWTFVGLIMTALNLMLAYKIAMIFDKIPR